MGVTGIEPVNHVGTVLQTVAFAIFATLPKPAGVDKEHHAGRIIYAIDYAVYFNLCHLWQRKQQDSNLRTPFSVATMLPR